MAFAKIQTKKEWKEKNQTREAVFRDNLKAFLWK